LSFKDKIYSLVARIPDGKVTTYAELARAAGKPRATRLVGQILNRNPNPVVVPCHRVVRSDGTVGGYASGTGAKRRLLAREGIRISDDIILDFEKVVHRF
jgi:methylated-DNA-[protein]-cysteine S-methyltransferase